MNSRLFSRKVIGLTLLVALLLPAFYSLSQWQWRRLAERKAFNVAFQAAIDSPPLTLRELAKTKDKEWIPVHDKGTWDLSGQLLVRKRSMNSEAGFWILTPFASVDGFRILVNRGWHAAANSAVDSPTVLDAPIGIQTIDVRVRAANVRDGKKPTDLPHGQVDWVIPSEQLDAPEPRFTNIVNYYAELTSETTKDLTLIPAPEISEGPHRSYAIQWLLFGAIAIVGWVILVRKELQLADQSDIS